MAIKINNKLFSNEWCIVRPKLKTNFKRILSYISLLPSMDIN